MHPHEIHHIKTYIVFCLVSIVSIGTLAYLYFPQNTHNNSVSSVLDAPAPNTDSSMSTAGLLDNTSGIEGDTISSRRMRLTQILIRSQKELQALEDQRKTSSQGLDPISEQKILKLRQKIVNLERLIVAIQ